MILHPNPNPQAMKTYTAFCQEVTTRGTIWISSIRAKNIKQAIRVARATCAADWSMEPADIHVLGLAAGDVEIVHWIDIEN